MNGLSEFRLDNSRQSVEKLLTKRVRIGGEGTAALNRAIVRWLESCRDSNIAPPKELVEVVAQQLKVDRRIRNQPNTEKRDKAIEAFVRNPEVSISKVARISGASRPTIGQWKKDPSFNFEVAMLRQVIESSPDLMAIIRANPQLTMDELETIFDGHTEIPKKRASPVMRTPARR